MYLAHIRSDLAYALSVVCQFMHNLDEQHMNVVIHILRYLKSALGKGIIVSKNTIKQNIEVCTNADWVGAVDDMRSTSEYFTFVGGELSHGEARNKTLLQDLVQKLSIKE